MLQLSDATGMLAVALCSVALQPSASNLASLASKFQCFPGVVLLRFPLTSQVALASFAFLFSEFVQYSQSRVSNIGELERRWANCVWLFVSSVVHR